MEPSILLVRPYIVQEQGNEVNVVSYETTTSYDFDVILYIYSSILKNFKD